MGPYGNATGISASRTGPASGRSLLLSRAIRPILRNLSAKGPALTQIARTIQLIARPVGAPKPADFRIAEVTLPDPGPGEVLLQMLWLSVDPYMRGRMSEGWSCRY
jgi:N-terminal domain of oxidoreductase